MQTRFSSASPQTTSTLQPAVDIVEDAAAIVLTADLPGVDTKDLSVRVDGRTLTVEAPLTLGEANALVSVYAEVRANHYRRAFELSAELDGTAISAELESGVLTIRIPKLEKAKPRRIEIQTS